MKALTQPQMQMYSALQAVAATEHAYILADGVAEQSVGRALARRGLAVVNGRMICPTPEAIEFRRGLAAQREKEAA